MQSLSNNPNIPAEVSALLRDFSAGLASKLGPQLAGAYLHGSLALGAFDPASSDLDFLVTTARQLTPAEMDSLAELHESLTRQYPHWGSELEGSYVHCADLNSLRPANDLCPGIERGGKLEVCEQDINYRIVHMFVLNRQGIVLSGPPARELLPEVSEADLRSAVLSILHNWWPMFDNPHRLICHYRGYAISPCAISCLSARAVAAAAQWA
jgi:hypothetical protein